MPETNNFDKVIVQYAPAVGAAGSYALEESNNMVYAWYLHKKHGYYIFNPAHARKMIRKWILSVAKLGKPLTKQMITFALDAAGYEDLDFLKSVTGEMRPPVKAGEGPRGAHPGGWADRTSNLVRAYRHKVIAP